MGIAKWRGKSWKSFFQTKWPCLLKRKCWKELAQKEGEIWLYSFWRQWITRASKILQFFGWRWLWINWIGWTRRSSNSYGACWKLTLDCWANQVDRQRWESRDRFQWISQHHKKWQWKRIEFSLWFLQKAHLWKDDWKRSRNIFSDVGVLNLKIENNWCYDRKKWKEKGWRKSSEGIHFATRIDKDKKDVKRRGKDRRFSHKDKR